MKPIILQLLPAAADLVGTAVDGTNRGVYVEVSQNGRASGPWECIWDDGVTLIFVRAQQGQAGLIIEVKVDVIPPPALAAAAVAA